jgi:hypothetical protein
MLIDRSHRGWAIVTLSATAVAALLYIYVFHPTWIPFVPKPATPRPRIVPGRTELGLVYGCLALAIFIFSALLGWRRKRPAFRIGRVQSWLRAHIWLSIFTIPLVIMHAGFITGGPMTTLLMLLYAIVMISGFYGLALQQFLPRMMAEDLPLEAIYEQIPYIRTQLLAKAKAVRESMVKPGAPVPTAVPAAAAAVTSMPADATSATPAAPTVRPEVLRMVDDTIFPYLEAENGRRLQLGNPQVSDLFFRRMRLETPTEMGVQVSELQGVCDERRQLDLQTRYQHWLHGWLIVHVPFSVALLILTVWHAVVAQFFR